LYGTPGGATPVTGDWDGDGKFSIGVIEPDASWKLKNVNNQGAPDFVFAYGFTPSVLPSTTAIPITGDWNGDGIWTPGFISVQGNASTWQLRNSNSAGAPDIAAFSYGGPPANPMAGDWNFPS